ncbi:hypothetical protein M3Y99_00465100 [Aphelenchoides fujianensis]|nr:hypothetical protein M3Y99_00465100 [Aphelenchoides fujianensis]
MDVPIPTIDDHTHVKIIVRLLGRKKRDVFQSVLDRLAQIGPIEVCEDSRRSIRPTFVTEEEARWAEFGELQAHRRIFGLIGVVAVPTTSGEADAIAALGAARASYDAAKSEFHKTLVNSRCVTFGRPPLSAQFFNTAELLAFETMEESEGALEMNVADLVRSIYFVLESRRLDLSYEKADQPPCPLLAEEERYRVGTENRQAKAYRKKCVGRLRKQSADFAMLAGLPSTALDLYQAAIEHLKSAGDLLWLAAAYDGWATAAIVIHYGRMSQNGNQADGLNESQKSGIQRTVSMTPVEMHEKSQHSLGVTIGHQRYRSDETQRSAGGFASPGLNSSAKSAAAFHSPNSGSSAALNQSGSANKTTLKKALALLNLEKSQRDIDYKEIIGRLKLALENYERFTFASYVEFECVIRVVNVYRMERMFIETENFLREHVGKYLSDTFTFFDNCTKSNICMIAANIYTLMGFKRKNAFYARLAVLFRLHVDDNEFRSESDYRDVYPTLYRTLPGYGINDSVQDFRSEVGYVSIQVKALHEVYMSAQRAGFTEAAIRHMCYMLQTYFFHIDSTNILQMIDELKRLVTAQQAKGGRISVAEPLPLADCDVVLPPIQMTRFPILSNFRIQPLATNLAPTVVLPADQSADVFIYSPFQERDRVKNVVWVVGTGCQVSVCMQNLLPTELVVKNLTLHAEGCEFEAIPIRLNLAAATTSSVPQTTPAKKSFLLGSSSSSSLAPPVETLTATAGEVALLGVPRSAGMLQLTGYSCEIFDVENVCSIRERGEIRSISVRVIQSLPRLQVSTTLKRAPVVDEETAGIAEATVFSGQTFFHSIKIQNTDAELAIRQVRIRVDQPRVYGGPRLVEILELDDRVQTSRHTNVSTWTLEGLQPNEKREIKFRIFGIDPAATAAADEKAAPSGEERQVFVRKQPTKQVPFGGVDLLAELDEDPFGAEEDEVDDEKEAKAGTSAREAPPASSAHPQRGQDSTVFTDESCPPSGATDEAEEEDEADEARWLLSRTNSVFSAEPPTPTSPMPGRPPKRSTHDLIPYTGRLLTADLVVTYVADVQGENGESYERTETLRLAITIVPALTVVEWHMIAGDTPSTRFVVVDVTNLCDSDAELTYGENSRPITVQPRELVRVPLLCPCSTQIQTSEFQAAAQRASHMMQMQEMEQLRRRLEKHVSKHLEIRWKIGALDLDGLVPVGPLLASVSFLKQLVVPSISICVEINDRPYLSEDDVQVGIGEMQRLHVRLIYAASESRPLHGHFTLRCFQDLQNGAPLLDRMDSLVICGVQRQPFRLRPEPPSRPLPPNSPPAHWMPPLSPPASTGEPLHFDAEFSFLFRTQGVYKIRPEIAAKRADERVPEDELFVPTVSFKVHTKLS